MRADGSGDGRAKDQSILMRTMSLSLYRVPDGHNKGQSESPCPSVYAPASALGSLSSVALSSAPASETLSRYSTEVAIHPQISKPISSTFLFEATNLISSTFLREAIGIEGIGDCFTRCSIKQVFEIISKDFLHCCERRIRQPS
jgi:hypothetical protein